MSGIASPLSRSVARWILAAAAVLLGAAMPAHATRYFVGADSQCDFTTIQPAIDAAIASSGSFPQVYIATNQTYTNQAISISPGNQSHISLIGGVPHCGTTVPAGSTTINGGANGSVITVRGAMNIVALSHLIITGGHGSSGGGIDYVGVGYMNIDHSDIFSNDAHDGGGIRFQGSGGVADLYLHANTFITNNTANQTGGGIRAEGQAKLHIDEAQIWIADNEAQGGYGGGIALIGPAYAHIGSPGYSLSHYIGVVYANTAQYGGGIALLSQEAGVAQADLFASDPHNPVRVEQNRAHHTGGGVYLIPYSSGGTTIESVDAALLLGGAQIDENAAQEGSGVYSDLNDGGVLGFVKGGEVYTYAGYCAAGIECNAISNNRAVNDSDSPTGGSALLIQSDGTLVAHQLTMRGNQGAHAIRVVDTLHQPLLLDTCLLAGNAVTAELVTLGSASAGIDQSTFANNTIGGASVVHAQNNLAFTNSIVAQGSLPTLVYTGSTAGLTLDYIMSLETTSLGVHPHIYQDDPSFVDPANGDFHLLANSLAIDVAPAGDASDRDLDNRPRDVDIAAIPNIQGARDLGAYERQRSYCGSADSVFCDGFDEP